MGNVKDGSEYPSLARIPAHVGMIMDGNGRWARQRNLPRLAGHRAGMEALRIILRAAAEFGIPIVTLYAFSTENWKRPQHEVQGLMQLLGESLDKEVAKLHENGAQIRCIGDLSPLPDELQRKIHDAEELTRNNSGLLVNLALNYGGRQEIVKAVREIVALGVPPEEITADLISRHLYTSDLPDPDLIIRTSGEFRTSNFLLWQSAYAEFYISPVYWPDFGKKELYQALVEFGRRERRYGGLTDSTE